MSWSAAAVAIAITSGMGLVLYAAIRLYRIDKLAGITETELKYEKLAREERERVRKITDEAEDRLDEELDNVSDLDFDERRRMLLDSPSSDASVNDGTLA